MKKILSMISLDRRAGIAAITYKSKLFRMLQNSRRETQNMNEFWVALKISITLIATVAILLSTYSGSDIILQELGKGTTVFCLLLLAKFLSPTSNKIYNDENN